MAGYDNANGPAGLVINLIDTAAKALDDLSDAAGEIAPDVGDLTATLVEAQRIADKAALDLRRLSKKVAGQKVATAE
ncbi:hypothetical protein [Azospirillum soli]|uniref:hypothetical protein n=1 Tax=Azospirillum soli TaxID=1304799 RepID=UPI001AE29A6E|nr:hypothetical protein [Azospirillum soli]